MQGRQGQDAEILRERAYADDTHLDVRYRTHQIYTVDPVDFGRWTLEKLPWKGTERVLDIGCGPGELLRQMAIQQEGWEELVGFDFSSGMIAKAARPPLARSLCFFVGDCQSVPLPAGHFDVVMTRHMLYHVPDITGAIAEAARVLRTGGSFLATTNSAYSMPEYAAIRKRAAARFLMMAEPEMVTARFSLENAPSLIEASFADVRTHVLKGTLRFPDARPFVEYFTSSRALTMRPEHTDEDWHRVLNFVQEEAEEIIACNGHLDVTKITGAIVGTKEA